ncbi:MAG: NADPH dehydrogenase NamA [Bacteroidota bacterium]|nr:NADPH dehydrogenase NamA [Bacteroidota bacterium]
MSYLFQPLSIKSIQIKNRITVSPMCQYSAEDGFVNDWHLVHLGSRAVGGAGLIITEACAVSPEGRISANDLGIWSDEHISGLQRITRFLATQGTIAGIQLAHAGRKASCARPWEGGKHISTHSGGWQVIAPSAVPFHEDDAAPLALSEDGIQQVIEDFRLAAKRALDAGFSIIEIHAAHGYLLHQFLSPLTNLRTDQYGGSFENRCRLLLQIVHAVQSEWPDHLPLFVRISATDWKEDGWTIDDSVQLARLLKEAGVDLIDCSSGGIAPHIRIHAEAGYQVAFAERIKKETGILTGAVGIITEARQAEAILAQQQADLIFIGREFLRNPYFPLQASIELNEYTQWPAQYERAKKV